MGDIQLKVGGNEKQGGPGRRQMLGYVLRLWRSRVICHLNNTCSFGIKFLLLFPLVTAKLIDDYFDIELYKDTKPYMSAFL
jgi:hypothetical protein